jgi:hypothetical protein
MKKLFVLFLLLFSVVSFSQQKKKTPKSKDLDKEVNISLDSLSKVYKKEVVFYSVLQRNGRKKISITYYDKNKNLVHETISDTPIED